MNQYKQHIININESARFALRLLSNISDKSSLTLFVIDDDYFLKGTITDGDIRRGLLSNQEISDPVHFFMRTDFKFIKKHNYSSDEIKKYRDIGVSLLPILNEQGALVDVLDMKKSKGHVPVSAVLVAGGRGERLKPLTDTIPKPMLKIGDKPIIEHNIDRLIQYGIKDVYISVNYRKESIINYIGNGEGKGISITYLEETDPLGTLGCISLIDTQLSEDILVMNSDILTNIDFEDFYSSYKKLSSSMMLASIPYNVSIPYAVLNTDEKYKVLDFEEKPNITYYSNGGIYIINSTVKNLIPKNSFFNATDLMRIVIDKAGLRLDHYPILGYWLDIGKQQDYLKAQEDIKHINI
jgi:dTDP-glucose pyrophosphorylase